IDVRFRHRATRFVKTKGVVTGVAGEILEPTSVERGQQSSRTVVDEFEIAAETVLVTSGGIGGNLDLVRKNWPVERLGPPPRHMVCGVPHHVDGRMVAVARKAGQPPSTPTGCGTTRRA